jgi:CubicO group peptidase (beta-lactamase class C family)
LIACYLIGSFFGRWTLAEDPPSPTSPTAQVAWPNTFAARRAQVFFDAVYAADDEPMREFQRVNRSPESLAETPLEQRVLKARSLRDQAGDLEFGKIETDGEYKVAVIAKSTKIGIWLRFQIAFNPDPPHYLISMQGTPTGPPDQVPIKLDATASLTQLLDQAKERSGLPALAVAVVKSGRIHEWAATGVRHINRPDRVSRDDRFHIGSIGKSMTATIVAKLIEEKTLSWDSKLGEVLADVAMRPEYAEVTIEQLLQHRGGIQAYTEDLTLERLQSIKDIRGLVEQRAAFVAQVLNEPPTAPPGSAMIYSNAGYSVAAHVAERTAKKPWEDQLTAFFSSLGMNHSGIGWPASASRPDQPFGHFDSPPHLRPQGFDDYELGHFLAPAGDVHCSIEDLARYADFHLQGLRGLDGWLKAETIRRLHRPPVNERPAYAGGWMVEEPLGEKVRHWHEGSAGTFYAGIALYPNDNFAIVSASNAGVAAKPVLDEVTAVILQSQLTTSSGDSK